MKQFFKLSFFIIIVSIQLALLTYLYKRFAVPQTTTSSPINILANINDVVTVDYAKQTATGSPLVFGGAHAPTNLGHQDAWDLLANVGMTMVRRDFNIESEVPSNITLNDYKSNKNNIQNAETWNKSKISWNNDFYQNAQKRGMKVIGILGYSPKWLTYSGTEFGVPKDWEVFEDIVKKSYRLHRQNLDMIEIWNEPDEPIFLNTSKSDLTNAEAYYLIFEHAVKAINSVDEEIGDGKRILVLAPGAASPEKTELIDYLLSKPASKHLDGVSIHSYKADEPSWSSYQEIMRKYKKENLPIYVTEWNKTSKFIKDNEYITKEVAISFTGKKLVQFLKYGIAGANYYSATLYDTTSEHSYSNSFGFYQRVNNKSELLPQGKTWQILSKSLDLGGGPSKIYKIDQPEGLEAIGFTNSKSQKGLAIVNEATEGMTVGVSLKNLKVPKNSSARLFVASADFDGKSPYCTQEVSKELIDQTFLVNLPAQSVIGITFDPPPAFNINLKHLFDILTGASTSRNCLTGL